MVRYPTLALLVSGLFGVLPALPAQSPTPVPAGYVLVDDMILPEDVATGDGTFNGTPWPFGVVFYEFAPNVSAANQVQARKAMAEISAVCGVVFAPHTSTPDYVVFNASTVNNSAVGNIGGAQTINITSWTQKYVIVHELMHALGFLHEQQRPDRDGFVTINWGNISATACPGSNCTLSGTSCVCNFDLVNGATTATPYDFDSIMHYSRAAFSANGQDTISCLPAYAAFQTRIGNRTWMSPGDAQALQARYGLSNVYPTITSISPPFVTTATGAFTLHVYGANFHEGSPNAQGVQGTRITWNGTEIPTTYEDDGHLSATIAATSISSPGQVQISVSNPAPGNGPALGSQLLSVSCQAGGLALTPGVPVTVANGCQQFSISPVYNAFNVVAIASISDWNLQMGSAQAAAGGNEVDFVAGAGFYGAGTIQPTVGNLTLGSGFSPGRLTHVVSAPLFTGQPTITSLPAGSNVQALHFIGGAQSVRTIDVAGPTNLRWKLLDAGPVSAFSWRSSETQVVASGTVGAGPLSGLFLGSGPYCLVIYKNGAALTATASVTVTMCFDFTPIALTASNNVTTLVQGAYACGPFSVAPQAGRWNVIGVSSPTDWDLQIGAAVSQQGGSNCDYVLANGHLGALSPLQGICSPYAVPGSDGSLQFGTTTTVPPALGSQAAAAADVIQAFEFEVTTPGNYDLRVSATGYRWDLHGPGSSSGWRRAVDRLAGPFAPATTVTVPNLAAGWHCIVVYHDGGVGLHGFSHSVLVTPSAIQPPVLAAISPDTAAAGSGSFTLAAYGSGFTPTSELRWNGAALATTYVSDTELSATVPSSVLVATGVADLSVVTPGFGSSSALPFTIGNPVPSISALTPDWTIAGGPTFVMSVFGADFLRSSEVRWNGLPLPTTFVDGGRLDAVVDASLVFAHAVVPVTVFNDAPAGGESAVAYFVAFGPQISQTVPAAVAVQPPGSAPFVVQVQGIYFLPSSVVSANGVALPTTFVDANTLDATLDPALFVQSTMPGAFAIAVANSVDAVSPLVPLVVDSGSNLGLFRTVPLAPAPGAPFALQFEGGAPFEPLTLIVDAGAPVPFNAWPDPVTNLVLGVTDLAGSTGPWLPLLDGVGLFGPADGTAIDVSGLVVLPGFTMPNPALGAELTVQALFLDPGAPLGFSLSWPLHPFGL